MLGSVGGAGLTLLSNESLADDAPDNTQGNTEKHREQDEGEKHLSPMLDYGTAGVVLGSFAQRVLYGSAIKGIDLNWKSALHLNIAAQGRILALKMLGGEEGKELAREDQHEIMEGLKPVAVLVGLSDATTTALKADEKAIFKTVEAGVLAGDFKYIKRPSIDAGKETWDSYLEEINNKIRTKASQIAAITTVLAPLGTTYMSSSLANSMKKEMLRMLYEQSYAQAVTAQLRKMNIEEDNEVLLDPDFEGRVHIAASKRAQDLFNGTRGFSKLMLTLAANTQGSWGIGDPPEIYFFKNHGSNTKRMAQAHSIGAANAQIFTVLMNLWWLRKADVKVRGMVPEFIKSELTTAKALLELLSNSRVRTVSFNDGRKFVKDMEEALLKDDPDAARQLKEIVQNIPDAKLQFSLRKYLSAKVQALELVKAKLLKQTDMAMDDAIFADIDTFVDNYPFLDDLRKGLAGQDPKSQTSMKAKIESTMNLAGEKIHNLKAEKIASLLEAMSNMDAVEAIEPETETEANPEDESNTLEAQARMRDIHSNLKSILTNYQPQRHSSKGKQASQILLEVPGERKTREYNAALRTSAEQIYELLAGTDRTVIADAIQKLTAIEEGEKDAIEGLEKAGTPGEDIDSIQHETHAKHGAALLSHSAKEVLWALLTQIPAVPSAARVAAKVIPLAAGVKEGEVPTASQLKTIITLTLILEAILSATADNVAAYLFGEKVLMDFFKSTYGADLFSKSPESLDQIAVASLKIAENAGNLTKVGNGPNFSQEEYTVLKDDSNSQGIAIDVSSLKMGDTLPHKNIFASAVNVMSIGAFSVVLSKLVDQLEIEKKLEQAK